MRGSLSKWCNRIIEYSFYAIFFLVPIVLTSDNSELFELSKMWTTWAIAIIIGFFWLSKMLLEKRYKIQRTPLDIPIALFFLSELTATFISLDSHVSFWGYYSRFNGGLLSTITYIFLYYAFVSNFTDFKIVKRLVKVSLFSGLIVCLWGLPSHFGHDPTCFLFRGSFDVSCWTADFHPTIRIFSTLGQPDWLAAYLAILIPVSLSMFVKSFTTKTLKEKKFSIFKQVKSGQFSTVYYFLLTALFFISLIYSAAKSGFLALIAAVAFFLFGYLIFGKKLFAKKDLKIAGGIAVAAILIIFFIGQPFPQFDKFTFKGLTNRPTISKQKGQAKKAAPIASAASELGGTDSGKIRIFVWQGAIEAWKANPLFGTGVETFAYAYYKYRPAGHNMTSEWNYLYNKAHNEYLNYLATTGAFGLGSYLLLIFWFLFATLKHLYQTKNHETSSLETLMTLGFISGYLSILVTNFFGFSVVIVNVYLFLIPAFVFVLNNLLSSKTFGFGEKQATLNHKSTVSGAEWTGILIFFLIAFYLLFTLFRFFLADKAYGLGYNLDHAGQYVGGHKSLADAIAMRDDEPVFKDELALGDSVLAAAFANQKDATTAGKLAEDAITTSDQVVADHPNNVVFWKSRVRIFYTLSQVDPRYLPQALTAIQKANALAPTDASISYNLGVLYGQNGDLKKGIETLQMTQKLKSDYRDAYYALGLFYHQEAVDKNGKVTDVLLQKRAVETMQYILYHIAPNDKDAEKAVSSWSLQ